MKNLVRIPEDAEIPLVGIIQVGVIDRGTNLLQVRPTSICNLNCIFCSTDAGSNSWYRQAEYVVDLDYLLYWFKEVANFKEEKVHAFVDSVGEVLTYKKILGLLQALKEMEIVKSVAIETNGTLLDEEMIEEMEEIGIDRINLSIHSLKEDVSKMLTGCREYDIKRIIEMAKLIAESKIELLITPVWIPGMNDKDIEEIIRFAIQINKNKKFPFLGIQKYEEHKYGRKPKGIKPISWWKFFRKLEEWSKKFGVELKLRPSQFEIEKCKMYPIVMKEGERVKVEIACVGWIKEEMIGVTRGRSVTVIKCDNKVGDIVNVRIIRNKHNLYVARKV